MTTKKTNNFKLFSNRLNAQICHLFLLVINKVELNFNMFPEIMCSNPSGNNFEKLNIFLDSLENVQNLFTSFELDPPIIQQILGFFFRRANVIMFNYLIENKLFKASTVIFIRMNFNRIEESLSKISSLLVEKFRSELMETDQLLNLIWTDKKKLVKDELTIHYHLLSLEQIYYALHHFTPEDEYSPNTLSFDVEVPQILDISTILLTYDK